MFSLCLMCFLCADNKVSSAPDHEIDVVSYQLTLEPVISEALITGTEIITLDINAEAKSMILSSGNLRVDSVSGKYVIGFKQNHGKVIIDLATREEVNHEIRINYHGTPTHGLFFNKKLDQAYTTYSTSEWMICNDAPNDKARFNLHLVVPNNTNCVASGELVKRNQENGKTIYSWSQDYESPTYTYGFAIGHFNETETTISNVTIRNLSLNYTSDELKSIFKETPKMVYFFEDKSGIPYCQSIYSQVLIGDHYQEMSGFSVLKESYGNLVLKDSTETNLISHELAHQWWGNRITCKNWNHFWLNEAFATYMSAAYNEYRFGIDKYNSDINSYFNVYQNVKKRGNDKPLVFKDWSNPSADDRNLVYFKGAYAIHLLRQEIGSQSFWSGIKLYSRRYFGKSVVTIDFQKTMEEASGKNLDAFFREWVYGTAAK